MAEIFGNAGARNNRGCFMVYTYDSTAGRGAVLILPTAQRLPTAAYTDPYMVVGFGGSQREAVTYTKTFGGRVYTFAFGHDPNNSRLTVQFMGFMTAGVKSTRVGAGGGGGFSSVTDTMLQAYSTARVSVTPQYARLMLGNSEPLRGFVVGMATETSDAEYNLQRFSIELGLPEVQ